MAILPVARDRTPSSLAGKVRTTLGSNVVVLLAVALANVIIARTLGVAGQGIVAAGTLLPMIVAYAGELGIPVAVGYLVNAQPQSRAATIAAARRLAFAMGTALVVVAVVAIVLLPLPSEARGLGIAFCLFPAMNIFHRVHLAVLQADLRLSVFNRIRMAGAATYLAILMFLWITGAATPLRVVLALLVANALWCLLSGSAAFSLPYADANKDRAKALLKYGARAHVGNVSAVDALKLDQLVLALFLSPHALGLYVVAMTVMMGNRIIGISAGMVGFPIASRRTANDVESRHQFRALLLWTFVGCGALALVEVVLGGRLLTFLFGEEFASGGRALQILAVGSVFVNLRQVYSDWLRGSGRPGSVALSELVAIVVLVGSSLLFWDGSIERVAWIMSGSAVAALVWLVGAVSFAGRRTRAASTGST